MDSSFKTRVLASLVQDTIHRAGCWKAKPAILVVGCGDGTEASALSLEFGVRVTGIDLGSHYEFDEEAKKHADLMLADATALPFPNHSFDFVYSHHMLEHIPETRKALSEMQRVLRPGGFFMVGTPNKNRIMGYWSSEGITWRKRFEFNWEDWQMRWRNQFENRYGAHAGFTEKELHDELQDTFHGLLANVTAKYYGQLYRRHRWLVSVLAATGMGRFLFPSLYFVGTKPETSLSPAASPVQKA
jgi:ubiquinone/menaquinone biosynthesis C-methylase UbiE